MSLRTAARLACLLARRPAASAALLLRGPARAQAGTGGLGRAAHRLAAAPWRHGQGPALGRRPGGLLLWRTAHSGPEQAAKKRDADELIKGYLLKATAVVAGVGVGCVLVPALALVAAGGAVLGLGALGLAALRYRRELGALRAIYNEHKKVLAAMNTLGVRASDVQRQQQLQQQLAEVFPKGHSNTRRVIGENTTGQACTEIEHHTVDGYTQVKIVFPVQGNMGTGRAFVKAEKDEEGTVLKSIKVIENRTGRPYRVYVRPRPARVIDADYQDVTS